MIFKKLDHQYKVFNKTNVSFFKQKARDSEMGILYYWFARYPIVSERIEGKFHIVEFSDLRFYMRVQVMRTLKFRRPFVLRIKMDNAGKIIESRFTRS